MKLYRVEPKRQPDLDELATEGRLRECIEPIADLILSHISADPALFAMRHTNENARPPVQPDTRYGYADVVAIDTREDLKAILVACGDPSSGKWMLIRSLVTCRAVLYGYDGQALVCLPSSQPPVSSPDEELIVVEECSHLLNQTDCVAVPWQSSAMVDTEALFRIGDAAQDAGNFDHARQSFERGAALGDAECLCRLGLIFDIGSGVATDKAKAMRLYRRAWRRGSTTAGINIAILYREQGNSRAMFGWWKRVAQTGDGSAQLEMAKSYLRGVGVKRDPQAALRCLASAIGSTSISEEEREEARAILDALRPRRV